MTEQAQTIATRVSEFIPQLDGLGRRVTQALKQTREMESNHQQQGQTIIESISHGLTGLKERQKAAHEAMGQLSEGSRRISSNTGKIVTSVQFHDIMRQQLEHIEQALVDGQNNGQNRAMGPLLSLQNELLLHSRSEVLSAIERTTSSLLNISQDTRARVDGSLNIGKASVGSSGTLVGNLRSDLNTTSHALVQHHQQSADICELVKDVANILGGMSASSIEIGDIGRTIRLISLNASVKAASLLQDGNALDTLAHGIRKLSGESDGYSAVLFRSLDEVNQLSGEWTGCDDDPEDGVYLNVDETTARLDDLVTAVSESASRTADILANMQRDGHQLADRIESVASGISIRQKIESWMQEALSHLDKARQQIGHSRHANRDQLDALESMSGRYTMASEREIHSGWTGAITSPDEERSKTRDRGTSEGPPVDSPAPEAADSLGDNVELF